jgi:hypothetical protein
MPKWYGLQGLIIIIIRCMERQLYTAAAAAAAAAAAVVTAAEDRCTHTGRMKAPWTDEHISACLNVVNSSDPSIAHGNHEFSLKQ